MGWRVRDHFTQEAGFRRANLQGRCWAWCRAGGRCRAFRRGHTKRKEKNVTCLWGSNSSRVEKQRQKKRKEGRVGDSAEESGFNL